MPATPPPTAYRPGKKLTVGSHDVQIEQYVSEGGFAHVYTCQTTPPLPDNLTACLKRVAVPNKAYLNLLRAEVEAMKRLKGYSNVVQYYDSHAERMKDGNGYEVFVLMEYCAGGGLIDFMNTRLRDQLKEHEVLDIMSDITLGLAHMHYLSPPLIHRDLKIENVLLTGDGKFKLCDFGSSSPVLRAPKNPQELQILEDDIQHHTTMQYRSPEMLDLYRGFPIDQKSDIWALGVFLYKLCFYTTPFEQGGNASILSGTYVIPQKPHYSDRLKNMIRVLLQPVPTQRPNVYQVLQEISAMRGVECPLVDLYSAQHGVPAAVPQVAETAQVASTPVKAPKAVSTQAQYQPELKPRPRPLSTASIDDGIPDGANLWRTPSLPGTQSQPQSRPQSQPQSRPQSTRFTPPPGPQQVPQQAPLAIPKTPVNAPTSPGFAPESLTPNSDGQRAVSDTSGLFETKFPALGLQPSPALPPTSPAVSDAGFDFSEAEIQNRFPSMDELSGPNSSLGARGLPSSTSEELLIDFETPVPPRPPLPVKPTMTKADSSQSQAWPTLTPPGAPVPMLSLNVDGPRAVTPEPPRAVAASGPSTSTSTATTAAIPSQIQGISDPVARAKAVRERAQAQIQAVRDARQQQQQQQQRPSANLPSMFAKSYQENNTSKSKAAAPELTVDYVGEEGGQNSNQNARKLKQILTGLSERSSMVILESDSGHIDSNMEFLRSLDAEPPHRPSSSLGHRHLPERAAKVAGHVHNPLHSRKGSLHGGWFGGRSGSGGSGFGKSAQARHESDDSDEDDSLVLARRFNETPPQQSPGRSSDILDGASLSSSPSTDSFRPSNSIQQRVHAFLSEQDPKPRKTAKGYGKYTDGGDGDDETVEDSESFLKTSQSVPRMSQYLKGPGSKQRSQTDDTMRRSRAVRPTVPSKSSKPQLARRNSTTSISTTSSGGSRRVPPKPAHLSPRPKAQQQAT